MNTIEHPEAWSEYELFGLMHSEMESLGTSGYSALRSLSEIGVRLNNVLDPIIRRHIHLSPEKSKVLFKLVDDPVPASESLSSDDIPGAPYPI